MTPTNREARLWDQRQARSTQRKIEQSRMEAVRPILEARAKAENKVVAVMKKPAKPEQVRMF